MFAGTGQCLLWLLFCSILMMTSSFTPICRSVYRSDIVKSRIATHLKITNIPIQEEDSQEEGSAEETEDSDIDVYNSPIIDMNPNCPKCYVVISNLQSGSNIGSICRNSLAFNVHEVIVIGRKGFRDKMRQADRGAKRRQTFVHFNSIVEASTYLKDEKNCTIVGIEIMDTAVSVCVVLKDIN